MIKTISSNKKFCAIAHNGLTFNDLEFYFKQRHQIILDRISPEDFDSMPNKDSYDFINLCTRSTARKNIVEQMTNHKVSKFSYIADPNTVANMDNIGLGVFLHLSVVTYASTVICDDVMVHGQGLVGHGGTIGQGTFIAGGVTIGGSSNIGRFCWIGIGTTIGDKVVVPDETWIAAGRVITSSKEFKKIGVIN